MENLWKQLKSKNTVILFALILFIGIILRLLIINLPLWYDEGCSWLVAIQSFPSGINDYLFNHDFQHTPLYFYYLHFWIKLFGDSDISMRLSSLIPSVSVLPLVYMVTKQLSCKRTALIAMFLTAVSVFQIYFASEVRMYPFVIIFSLLSINALLRYIKEFKISQLTEMIFYNIILCYLMVGAFIFVISEVICLISHINGNKEQLKKILYSNIIFLVFLIPYFCIVIHYFLIRNNFLIGHQVDFSFLNLIGIMQKFLSQYLQNGMYWVSTQPYIIGTKEFLLFLIPLFVMLFAIYRALIKKTSEIKLIASITVITFFLFILTAQFNIIVLSSRYLIYISPLLLILAAIGISTFSRKKAIYFLIFFFCAGMFYLFYDPEIVQYKTKSLYSPAAVIKNELQMTPQDLVIMPFGSSIISHYLDKDSPQIMKFEAIQEFRQTNNHNIYSENQQKLLKNADIQTIFSQIIIPNTNISENFVNYINSYLNDVPVERYVLIIITGSDVDTFMTDDVYYNYFASKQYLYNNLTFSLMVEFFHSLNKIMTGKFEIVSTNNDGLQMYVLYKKISD